MSLWKERRPRATDYTPAQIATLRRMAGKAPATEIAAVLGRSTSSVQAKAQKLGISLAVRDENWAKRSRWTPEDIGTLARLAQTHTQQEVAAILGRTLYSVRWRAEKDGIRFQKNGEANHSTTYPRSTLLHIAALRAQGMGQRRIARATGVSVPYARNIIEYRSRYREYMQIEAAQLEALK